jgi:hypothetical protein
MAISKAEVPLIINHFPGLAVTKQPDWPKERVLEASWALGEQ